MSVIPQHTSSYQSSKRKQTITQKWLELSPCPLDSLPGPLPKTSQPREAAGRNLNTDTGAPNFIMNSRPIRQDWDQPLCLQALRVTQFTELLQGP